MTGFCIYPSGGWPPRGLAGVLQDIEACEQMIEGMSACGHRKHYAAGK